MMIAPAFGLETEDAVIEDNMVVNVVDVVPPSFGRKKICNEGRALEFQGNLAAALACTAR